MAQFQIKRGYKRYLFDEDNNLLITPEEGCWYLVLDTTEVFVAIDGQLKPLNQAEINLDEYDERFEIIESRLTALENKTPEQEVYTFAEFSQFPSRGAKDIIYIALDKNASYIFSEQGYICIGNTDSASDIKLIDGGSAKE